MREKIYTTFQVADICNVRPTTVIKWANQNIIRAYTTPGGHRRIRQADLRDFLRQYNIPAPPELSAGLKQVLVVEDDAAVGALLLRALGKASAELDVQLIRDGVEALLAIGRRPPDLILLDVVMPVMDGLQVLKTLRSDPRAQKIKVIAMTGKKLNSEDLGFVEKRADAFFFKPLKIKEVAWKALELMGLEETAATR
ncbi:MAG: response regulator [Elusimicrobiota bacterium]|jgi:excisionase family DNA binding protein